MYFMTAPVPLLSLWLHIDLPNMLLHFNPPMNDSQMLMTDELASNLQHSVYQSPSICYILCQFTNASRRGLLLSMLKTICSSHVVLHSSAAIQVTYRPCMQSIWVLLASKHRLTQAVASQWNASIVKAIICILWMWKPAPPFIRVGS